MLKITRNPTFTATVKVQIPTDNGHLEASFKARFKALTISEAEAFDMGTLQGTNDWLRTILIGWDGVVDEDGNPAPFDVGVRDQLLDLPWTRMAVMQAYNGAMLGAKRGN